MIVVVLPEPVTPHTSALYIIFIYIEYAHGGNSGIILFGSVRLFGSMCCCGCCGCGFIRGFAAIVVIGRVGDYVVVVGCWMIGWIIWIGVIWVDGIIIDVIVVTDVSISLHTIILLVAVICYIISGLRYYYYCLHTDDHITTNWSILIIIPFTSSAHSHSHPTSTSTSASGSTAISIIAYLIIPISSCVSIFLFVLLFVAILVIFSIFVPYYIYINMYVTPTNSNTIHAHK